MSALDMEKARAEFEAWVLREVCDDPRHLCRRDAGQYVNESVESFWIGWQACTTGYAGRVDVLETKILGLSSNQDGLRARLLSALDRFERAVALLDRHGLSLCDECDDAGCVCCRGDRPR